LEGKIASKLNLLAVDRFHPSLKTPKLKGKLSGAWACTVKYDSHEKLRVDRRNGVQEYLVWRVYNCELEGFRLRDGEYVQLELDGDGIICSEVFPGWRLDQFALLAGDLARVLEVLQQGLAALEHQSFVENLS
jgi:hypothetical protein